jgi:hypothetical protein
VFVCGVGGSAIVGGDGNRGAIGGGDGDVVGGGDGGNSDGDVIVVGGL